MKNSICVHKICEKVRTTVAPKFPQFETKLHFRLKIKFMTNTQVSRWIIVPEKMTDEYYIIYFLDWKKIEYFLGEN